MQRTRQRDGRTVGLDSGTLHGARLNGVCVQSRPRVVRSLRCISTSNVEMQRRLHRRSSYAAKTSCYGSRKFGNDELSGLAMRPAVDPALLSWETTRRPLCHMAPRHRTDQRTGLVGHPAMGAGSCAGQRRACPVRVPQTGTSRHAGEREQPGCRRSENGPSLGQCP